MKKNLTLIKLAVLLNTLSLTGYIAYNELEKKAPQSDKIIKHTCQIMGTDQANHVFLLNCIEEQKD
jgi:hypothetical protein